MPLNILFDARPLVDPKSGGVRRVAHQLLEALVRSDANAWFTCVTTGMKKPALPEPFASYPNITHVHVRMPNKLWSLLAMFGLVSLDRSTIGAGLRSRNSKLATRSFFDAAILPNLGFTGPIRIPYALILHDLSFLIEPKWFPLKTRIWHVAVRPKRLARSASRLFCVSETTARDAERLFGSPRDKIRVFIPGITTLSGGEVASGNPYVLAFNETDPRKNVATAIEAIDLVRRDEACRNLRLIIVGAHVRNSKLETRNWIERLERPSDAELANLYRHASALLYPSWYEGYGLPLHEAARFGTPCIASTMGALPETAPRGTLFAPPSKPHLWGSIIKDVLTAPNRYRTTFNEDVARTDVTEILAWLKNDFSTPSGA